MVGIFEVTAVGPFADLHGDAVTPFAQERSRVELGRQRRIFGVTDVFAVDPDVISRIDAPEMQRDIPVAPRRREVEFAVVTTHGIVAANAGRIDREGITDVGIVGKAVAVHLPAGGHGNRVPPFDAVAAAEKIAGTLPYIRIETETPRPVEEKDRRSARSPRSACCGES